ncbi:topoisomerase C-terminal repeat-containing protein [Rhizobium sp. 32-5/1]|nr:topoisomerase C-terminal repeat-containing protein [Rhizobium sp. 32-5/1]WEZ85222.1 topoisomerase C-terminal repeat-containing protein [Rhizobium sp. 32-5/1]
MISSGLGRYGPFILHEGKYANVETIEDVFSIGLNRAVSVLADKASKGPGGRGAAAAPLKEIGDHPDGGAITVKDGKYGPYVNWGKVNATLTKGKDPQSVTIEDALLLIAERIAKDGGKPAKAKATKTAKPKATKAAKADGAEATTAKPKAAPKKKAAAKPKAPAKPKTAAKAKKD